jgi:ActR/RegA family two-component response regulator
MAAARVLFVDDEPALCATMPAVLEQHGFAVTAVDTVDRALSEITSHPFDVLISDLNIGQPGDGFVVVGAMRRTQPLCVTLILTGFPGFETALQAIRSQVDDYLIKPAPVPTLVKLIEQKLRERKPGVPPSTKRVAEILRKNVFEITQRTLRSLKADPMIGALPLTDEDWIEQIPHIVEGLAATLESAESRTLSPGVIRAAELRGEKRYRQGYTIPMLATGARLLETAIYDVIHENLLSINLSYFVFDLKRLNETLGLQLELALQSYLNAERRTA